MNVKLETKQVEETRIDTSIISIIEFDAMNYWIFENASSTELTEQDLELIENILSACIDEYNPEQKRQYNKINQEHPEYNLKLESFIIKLDGYKRQYVAVVNEKGEKEVWINCLCNTLDMDWRKELIEVQDGGNCYFNLKINLTKGEYYDLMVNGEA